MEKFTKKIILLVALTLGLIYGVNGQASNTYYYIGGPTGSVDFTSTSWVLAANYTSGSAMTAVAPSVVNATVVFIIDASDVGPASGAQLGTNITLSLGGARTIGQLIIRNNNVPVTISGTGSLLIGGATTAQIPGAELDLGTGCSLNINNSGTVGSIISTSNVCINNNSTAAAADRHHINLVGNLTVSASRIFGIAATHTTGTPASTPHAFGGTITNTGTILISPQGATPASYTNITGTVNIGTAGAFQVASTSTVTRTNISGTVNVTNITANSFQSAPADSTCLTITGILNYNGAGAQTVTPRFSVRSTGQLQLGGTGSPNNKTMPASSNNSWIWGKLSIQGTAAAITNAAIFKSEGTLEYKNSITATVTAIEWPATNSPKHVIVDNSAGSTGITLGATKSITGNLTLTTGVFTMGTSSNLTVGGNMSIGASGIFTSTSSGPISVGGNLSVATGGTMTAPTASTGIFTMTGNGKTISGPGTVNFSQLTIAAGANIQLLTNINLYVNQTTIDGTLDCVDKVMLKGTGTPSISVSSTGYVYTSSSNGFKGYTTSSVHNTITSVTLNAASTVEFNGTAQNIWGAGTYGNVIFSGTGTITKTVTNGDLDINGNLTVNSNVTLDVSSSNYGVSCAGNIDINGAFNARAGVFTVDGSLSTQTIDMGAATNVLYSLTLANSVAGAMVLGSDVYMGGSTSTPTLTFSNGYLTLGNYNFYFGSAAGFTSQSGTKMLLTNGNGRVYKSFTTGDNPSFTYPIGENTGTLQYTPVALDFSAKQYAGSVGVKVVDADPLNTNGTVTDYLTRYWSFNDLTSTVGTYTYGATFTYITGTEDLPGTANLSNVRPANYDSAAATWAPVTGSAPASGTFSITAGATETTSLLDGHHIAGRATPQTLYWRSNTTGGTWTDNSKWSTSSVGGGSCSCTPASNSNVVIEVLDANTFTIDGVPSSTAILGLKTQTSGTGTGTITLDGSTGTFTLGTALIGANTSFTAFSTITATGTTGNIAAGKTMTTSGSNEVFTSAGGVFTVNGTFSCGGATSPIATTGLVGQLLVASGGTVYYTSASQSNTIGLMTVQSGGTLKLGATTGQYSFPSTTLPITGTLEINTSRTADANPINSTNGFAPSWNAGSTLKYTNTTDVNGNTAREWPLSSGPDKVVINCAAGKKVTRAADYTWPTSSSTQLTLTTGELILSGSGNEFRFTAASGTQPIARTGGTLTCTTCDLAFVAGSGSGNNWTLPDDMFTTAPTIVNVTMTMGTNTVTLNNQDIIISGTLTYNAGLVILGSGDLQVATLSPSTVGSYTYNTRMFVTSAASGFLTHSFATGSGSFVYPIGENLGTASTLDYNGFSFSFGANDVANRVVGWKVVDACAPNNGSPTYSLSRYFQSSLSDTTGTYTYSANLPFDNSTSAASVCASSPTAGDAVGGTLATVVGSTPKITVMGFLGTTWRGYEGGISSGTLSIVSGDEITSRLAKVITGRTLDNDVPCGAYTLTPAVSCANTWGVTQGSTQSYPGGCNSSTADDDVWYKFVATDATTTITVTGTSSFDPVIQAYTYTSGTCPSATYTAIASTCTDITGNGATETLVLTGLSIGTTYYVRVYSYSGTMPSAGQGFNICATIPPIYTWIGTNGTGGSGDWQTSTHWSPTRTTPSINDILQFTLSGTPTVSNVPTQQVSSIEVSGNTVVILTPATSGDRTITISDGSGVDLDIQSGSSLRLSANGSYYLDIDFTSAGNPTTTIAGTLTVDANCTYDGYYAATTLTGTHNNNGTTTLYSSTSADFYNVNSGGVFVNSGTLSGFSTTSFLCNTGGKYQHNLTGGTIPTVTWNTGSTCEITGAISTMPSGMNQTFYNFTWNSASQSATVSLDYDLNVTNTFTMANSNGTTNGILLSYSSGYDINCANFVQTGGKINMGNGGFSTNIFTTGSFTKSAGQISLTSAGDGKINFNGTTAQTVNITGGTIAGLDANNVVDFVVNNPAGITLPTGSTLAVPSWGTLFITQGNVASTGGIVSYSSTLSTLAYNSSTASQTANIIEFPSTNGPTSLTINNTFGDVTFPSAITRSLAGTLTLTDGNVDLNGSTLTLGTGTGTLGTLTQNTNAGWLYNGTFKRWYSTSSIVSSQNTNPDFPIGLINARRSIFLWRPTGTATTGGTVSVSFTNTAGLTAITPFVDGVISIDKRTNQYWAITAADGLSATGLTIEAFWDNAPFTITTASQLRLIQASAAAGAAGSNSGSGTDWNIERSGLTSTALTNNFYVGSIAANLISNVQSVATGNWSNTATWNCACLPGAGDNVTINNTHNVTVDITNAAADNLTVNAGGTLTISNSSNALTVGPVCGGNRNVQVDGTLALSAGTFTINGNLETQSSCCTNANFNISGGSLVIDGNDGTLAGSVAKTIPLLKIGYYTTTAVTGGTITIVDPHYTTTASELANNGYGTSFFYEPATTANWSGNTLTFGGTCGTTPVAGATAVNGFAVNAGGSFLTLGNVTINGGASHRPVSVTNYYSNGDQMTVGGLLTINASSELKTLSAPSSGWDLYAAGNITNNGTLTIAAGTEFGLCKGASTATTVAQTLTGGTYTVNGNMRINNTNPTITLSTGAAFTVAGTLYMHSGRVLLGTNNFTIGSAGTVSAYNTLSATNMFAADGAGQFMRVIPTSPSSFTDYLFPVGDNTTTAEYSPVTLNFSVNNTNAKTIGVNLVDGLHPNHDTPIAGGSSKLTRYWNFTAAGTGTYTYSGQCKYINAAADITGTEGNITMQSWNGSAWANVPGGNLSTSSHELQFGSTTTSATFPLTAVMVGGRMFPPPANDDCANAASLTQNATCGTPTPGTTVNATGTLGLYTGDDDDVWYSFNAASTGAVIEVVGTGGFNPVVNLRDNSACNSTNITYHGFTGANGTEVIRVTGLTVGQTYRIRVFSAGTGASNQGTFTICVYTYTATGNDQVANATTAAVGTTNGVDNTSYGFQITSTTSGVTSVEPMGFNWITYPYSAANSQWFKFTTPPSGGCYSVASTFITGGSFDTQLAIYTASNTANFNTYTEIASNDDGGTAQGYGLYSSYIGGLTLTGSTTYYFQVTGFPYTNAQPSLIIINNAVIAPVATTAGSPGCTGFNANWNASTNAASYILEVATDLAFTNIVYNQNVGNVLNQPISGLTAGTNFYYRVRAVNSCAVNSTYSNIITIDNTPAQPLAYTTSSTSVCAPQAGVVYTVPNDATVTYNWLYTGSGATINGTGNSVTVDFASNATGGTLRVTASKCSITSAPRDVAITITPNVGTPSFTLGASALCVGGTSTYNATATNSTSITYSIFSGGASINPTSGLVSSVTSSFVVRATAAGTCGPNTTQDFSVTVTPNVGTPSFTLGATTLCVGGTSTYTATATNSTSITYSIFSGGASINPTSGLVSSVTSSFVVRATAAGTCGPNTTADRSVTVTPLPTQVVATAGSAATLNSINANWNAAANATSYILQVSTVSNFASTVFNSNVGNVTTYTVGSLTAGTTYYYRVTAVNSCGNATVSNTITYATIFNLPGYIVWDGSSSIDWNDATNWTPQTIPTAIDDVYVPNVANDPSLTTGANGFFKDITITTGATIAIGAGKTIDVKGNWSGANNTVSGSGDLIFSGTAPQSIGGGATIENLMVNNNAGVTVASGANMVNVTEALKLVVGQMTTNGNVTIISTALNQGYIDDFSGSNAGTLSGNIKVERYITNGPNGFRYIGAPVYNNVNGLSLSGVVGPAFPVQGTPGQAIPQGTCSFNNSPTNLASNSPYATFMRWNEPGPFTNFCRQQGWYFQTSGDMTLGRGYGAKLAGGSKLTYTGAANTGAITYAPCTHTDVFVNASPSTPTYDGWNLVSNPFPSNIEISSIPGDGDPNNNMPAGFDGQIQFYQTTGQFTGTYLTYNVGTQVAPIALGQGFWVRVTNTGTANWSLTNSHRVTTDAAYHSTNSVEDHMNITVSGNGFMDQTDINFLPEATAGFDFYDASKWLSANGQPTLYTKIGTDLISINSNGSLTNTALIPMGLIPGADGTFTLNFNDIASFPLSAMIVLEDLQLDSLVDLRQTTTYTFTQLETDSADRFIIHFQPGVTATVVDQDCDHTGSITYTQAGTTVWSSYNVKDNSNNTYAQGSNYTGAITVNNLAPQEYILNLTHSSGYTAQEFITVNDHGTPISLGLAVSDTTVLIGETVNFTATATNATGYDWNFGDSNTAQGGLTQQHSYAAVGDYVVTITATNDSCSKATTKTVHVGTVGINNTTASNLSIYGQGERVVVQFNNWGGTKADIFMYNTLGQRVESLTGVSTIKGRQELNVAGIKPGYYLIQVVSDGKIQSQKIYLGNY